MYLCFYNSVKVNKYYVWEYITYENLETETKSLVVVWDISV